MHNRLWVSVAVAAALVLPMNALAAHHVPPTGRIRHDGVHMYARPSLHSRIVATLMQQAQVQVTHRGAQWDHVQLWGSIRGWIVRREVVFGKAWFSVSTYQAPQIHIPVHPSTPQRLQVHAMAETNLSMVSTPGGQLRGQVATGSLVRVQAWQQDSHGGIWYRIGRLWTAGSGVRFLTEPLRLSSKAVRPGWSAIGGKGMWLTLGTVTDSSPDTLVQAARQNGITHLYLESAISPLGFHGRFSVGPLLDAAHAAHIAVIAWVYPYLYDVAADVMLTRLVAHFRTTKGSAFDGIAADLEQNMTAPRIRAYSQLIRAMLGPRYLLVGVTYPPESISSYPFGEVARQYSVIAPMDYWHQTQTRYGLDFGHMPYSYRYGYEYALDSIRRIRRVTDNVPLAPIGQAFDNFGRLEMGPYAPSAAEIQGFLAGCKQSGAIGASFFQWMTVGNAQWRAIGQFHY